jgi:hypothetical protein
MWICSFVCLAFHEGKDEVDKEIFEVYGVWKV